MIAFLRFALLIAGIFIVEVFVLGVTLLGLVYSRGGIFVSKDTRFLASLSAVLLAIALLSAWKLTPSTNVKKEIPWFALHKR
jgi:hypothetical protein